MNDYVEIKRLHGTDTQLYQLVAPLVMNPAVLKQNNNYPFRTSDRFEWLIAQSDERILGFIPIEHKASSNVINNYYIANRDADLLSLLIQEAIRVFPAQTLTAVAFRDDEEVFLRAGFTTEKRWTLYVKMKKEPAYAK